MTAFAPLFRCRVQVDFKQVAMIACGTWWGICASGLRPWTCAQFIGATAVSSANFTSFATRTNIDFFDQWGVELGKQSAQRIVPEFESREEPALAHDSSTNHLIHRYRKLKEAS